jgi:replication fork protection complex subunit Tof1/Swi1
MADGDVISVSSGEEQQDPYLQRRAILEPAIIGVVNALGGYEGGVYRLGDEAYGCLKDLKKFWRKDETDDERTVARILWASRVLPNDLVPIVLETAGKGHVEDKRAIACADLITAMTWPIDLAEELKELDEEFDRGSDYTQLVQSHLHYKAALLKPGVLQALFSIVLPCLARGTKTRTERDVQIVNVILHLIRNLAFIKDLPANVHLSADQAEFSSLQSRLIRALSESRFFDLLLTIASSATSDATFNSWNALVLEIFYLLFRGVKPTQLVLEQSAVSCYNPEIHHFILPLVELRCFCTLPRSSIANEAEPATAPDDRGSTPARLCAQSTFTSLALWNHHLGTVKPEKGFGSVGSAYRR